MPRSNITGMEWFFKGKHHHSKNKINTQKYMYWGFYVRLYTKERINTKTQAKFLCINTSQRGVLCSKMSKNRSSWWVKLKNNRKVFEPREKKQFLNSKTIFFFKRKLHLKFFKNQIVFTWIRNISIQNVCVSIFDKI